MPFVPTMERVMKTARPIELSSKQRIELERMVRSQTLEVRGSATSTDRAVGGRWYGQSGNRRRVGDRAGSGVLSRLGHLDEQTRNDKDCSHNQRIKLLGGGRMGSILGFHLPLPDHMHLYERVPFARVFVCSDRQGGCRSIFGLVAADTSAAGHYEIR
jgi:hypothetical protein